MTDAEIRAAILASEPIIALVEAGDDAKAAELLTLSTSKTSNGLTFTDKRLAELLGATKFSAVMLKLEQYSQSNKTYAGLVKRMLTWLSPSNGGIEIGSEVFTTIFSALTSDNTITSAELDSILNLGRVNQKVTTEAVSSAAAIWRPDGKLKPIPRG